MAYKPYKVNKGEKYNNNYKHYYYQDRKNITREQIAAMKTFGLRSGKAWKMIPALAYYVFFAFCIIGSLISEFIVFEFELYDIPLVIVKYIFIIILFFSPMIFLSNYRYTRYIPLFNSGDKKQRIIGILTVVVICSLVIGVCKGSVSEKYYNSTVRFFDEKDQKSDEYMKNINLEDSSKE